MPPAARMTDVHACKVHPPNKVEGPCCLTVLIGNQPAARVTDLCTCTAPIVKGSPTVLIGYQQAARIGDPTGHGGNIATGCLTVIIGDVGGGGASSLFAANMRAAKQGACAFT